MRSLRHTISCLQPALVLMLILWVVGTANAQSPFALRNVGQRLDPDDARMAARGYWGMAVTDSLHPGFKNVASLSSLRHVALQLTGLGEQAASDDGVNERTTYRAFAPNLRVALPVVKEKVALTAGFRVDRSMDFLTYEEMTWYAWTDTITGNQQFRREGTLFEVPLGVAVSPVRGLSLAATLGLVNGSTRETLSEYYIEPSGSTGAPFYETTSRIQEDDFSGTAVTWSALWSRWDRLQLGLSYMSSYDLDVDRKISTVGVSQRGYETYGMTMPESWRAGLQVKLSERWHCGGDYHLEKYSAFEGPAEWTETMGGRDRPRLRVRT